MPKWLFIFINMKTSQKIIFAAFIAGVSILALGSEAEAQTVSFKRNLTVGSRGADVSSLQQNLIRKGYLKTAATGYFGPSTRAALAAWQKAMRISPASGYFGPLSRTKIVGAVSTPAPAVPPQGYPAPVADAGIPVRIRIPKLNVNTVVRQNGLKADGSLDAPANISDVGWYKLGAAPGEQGNAVLTGHVAQIRGGVMVKPGVFHNLSSLKPGDKIYVENNKGETITFTVRASKVYDPNADAPEVFAATGGSKLNIITCEGTWNPAQQSYTGRLVVFADKTS